MQTCMMEVVLDTKNSGSPLEATQNFPPPLLLNFSPSILPLALLSQGPLLKFRSLGGLFCGNINQKPAGTVTCILQIYREPGFTPGGKQ